MTQSSQELIEKLSRLPSHRLATALVELRYAADCIEPAIERLLAKPEERIARFHAGLKKALSVGSRGRSLPADHLRTLLLELKTATIEPAEGFFALLEFFRQDELLIVEFDDDYGSVGALFEGTAAELLAGFASGLNEESVVVALEDLLRKDDYGVRSYAWQSVTKKLSVASLRKLEVTITGPMYVSAHPRRVAGLLESLAVALDDMALLESALTMGKAALAPDDYLKLAQAHLAKGEFQSALDRLDADPTGGAAEDHAGQDLRIRCLKQLGRTAEHFLLSWERFTAYPTIESFELLVQELGEQHRVKLVTKAAEHLLHTKFRVQNAILLLRLGYGEKAERYVYENRECLHHASYGYLSELAGLLKSEGRGQVAILCYRRLLEDILARGKSKAYHHAVDYFRALAELDPEHSTYVLALRARHGRKYGFWSMVAQ